MKRCNKTATATSDSLTFSMYSRLCSCSNSCSLEFVIYLLNHSCPSTGQEKRLSKDLTNYSVNGRLIV